MTGDADAVVIDAIHFGQRIAVLEDGSTLPLKTLLDSDGEETDSIEDAVSAVAPLPDGRWVVIEFGAFEPRLAH